MDKSKYCAFLRGVNVNGRKMLMEDVCEVFRDFGMAEVSSILATGNILFQSELPKEQLKEQLHSVLSAKYSSPVYLFVKSREELSLMRDSCPFEPSAKAHKYVFICEAGFEERLLEEFTKIRALPTEEADVKNGVFYWSVPKGSTLDAGFSKTLARRDMKDAFTSRNINTIEKICAKIEV